jgi:UDP-N-acetylmuramoylalanine--D-glutamate ligase
MEEYVGAKLNILRHQVAFSRHGALSFDARALRDERFGARPPRMVSRKHPVENGTDGTRTAISSTAQRTRRAALKPRDVRLLGLHNIENCLRQRRRFGEQPPRAASPRVAKSIGGVEAPHRVSCASATACSGTTTLLLRSDPDIAGSEALTKKLIVIAGGYDKQIPFEPLAQPLIERAKAVILTGPTAKKIEAALVAHPDFAKSGLTVHHAEDLADAVKKADALAAAGDIVTLSPACASFDAFKNFEERGKYYKKLVNAL